MLKPTQAELDKAEELEINPEGLNGEQLRKKIRLIENRNSPKGPDGSISLPVKQYNRLRELARKLNLTVKEGESLRELRHMVGKRIGEILRKKGITPGVVIQYSEEAGAHANERAVVVDTEVIWIHELPYIVLRAEGAHSAHSYDAYPVLFYATVVTK